MRNNSALASLVRWGKKATLAVMMMTPLIFSGCLTPDDNDPPPEPMSAVIKRVGSSVVNIETDMGKGSGVIFNKEGYIITNDHVIRGATKIEVHLLDKRKLDAALVATEPRRDIAIIKVEGDNLQAAEFADSKILNVGDEVVAIGNAKGVENSVSKGIISNLNVDVDTGIDIRRCIQTDAPINPGNSGGALINKYGKVIGINDMGRGDAESMNYAIPSNDAKDAADQIIAKGYVSVAYIGVNADNRRTDEGQGFILIQNVMPNSPAEKCGLKKGDVIIKVNDVRVETVSRLREQLKNSGIGSTVSLDIMRKGKKDYESGIAQVKIEELPKGYYSIDWS